TGAADRVSRAGSALEASPGGRRRRGPGRRGGLRAAERAGARAGSRPGYGGSRAVRTERIMDQLLILAVAGVGVWALRASAIVFAGGRTPSETTMRTLDYARHAVLAALVASAVAGGEGMAGLVAPSPQ